MKTNVSSALLAYLVNVLGGSDWQGFIADLYTFTLVDGTVLRYPPGGQLLVERHTFEPDRASRDCTRAECLSAASLRGYRGKFGSGMFQLPGIGGYSSSRPSLSSTPRPGFWGTSM